MKSKNGIYNLSITHSFLHIFLQNSLITGIKYTTSNVYLKKFKFTATLEKLIEINRIFFSACSLHLIVLNIVSFLLKF